MKLALTVLIIVVALYVLYRSRQWTKRAREVGRYPAPGQGTDEDVRRFVRHGRKMTAMKLYREIHGVDITEAKKAVERMAGDGDSKS